MEPISYLRAPLRRWPVVVPFVVILAVVAVLIPYHQKGKYPTPTWEATSDLGLAPAYTGNKLGAKLGVKQLEFYVHQPAVIAAAAKAEHVQVTSKLRNDVVITKSKKSTVSQGDKEAIVAVAVLQKKKDEAVSFTNAFVVSLDAYTQAQLVLQQKNDIATQTAYIHNLQNAIDSLPHKTKPTTTTTKPKTTTTTHPATHHAKHHHAANHTHHAATTTTSTTKPKSAPNVTNAPATTSSTSTSTTTTTTQAAASNSGAQAGASGAGAGASLSAYSPSGTAAAATQQPKIVLVQEPAPPAESTTSTTLTPGGTLTPSSTPVPVVIVPSTIPGQVLLPTTTTTEPFQKLIETQEERALGNQLAQAQVNLLKLEADGTPKSGLRVVQPATKQNALLVSPKESLLGHRSVRGLLGLLLGLILGVVTAWLLDGFDRRLRTSKRAEQVFGLPVVVEVPGSNSKTLSVIPVVDIVVDPYSDASEAYRKLHVAIMNAPPVTWVKRGSGYDEEPWSMPAYRPPVELPPAIPVPPAAPTSPGPGAAAADAPPPSGSGPDGESSSGAPTSEMRLPVAARAGALVAPRRSRFSILITSPTDEPTRSLVVVNLAAVFAEAGDRVLVATTGGMRTEIEGNGGPKAWEGPDEDMDATELVANARPSQIPGVSSLALGQVFSNPSRFALQAPALVEAARDVVDVLLLEAPLLSTQDGAALLPAADLVVVVCEAWRTTVADGVRTQRLLAQRRPPVLGLVMTSMPPDRHSIHAKD